MELKDTIEMMTSHDYKERFKAEYYQTLIRYKKLCDFWSKAIDGKLDFEPACPLAAFELQTEYMDKYLSVLRMRAAIEGIKLPKDVEIC